MTLMQLNSEPTSLVAVHDQCAQIEEWADQCHEVAELREAANRLAAIDAYLERTSREGRGRVAQTLRRLEVRIGEALGPAEMGGDRRSDQFMHEGTDLTPNQRSEFRRMAENREAVEDEIADSSDEQPASRRRVMDAIKRRVQPPPRRTVADWTEEEQTLRKRMLEGETVVVNLRTHKDLIAWAQTDGRYLRVDRQTPWGNPFLLDDDGDRATVIHNYEHHYLPHKPSLTDRYGELRGGKALGCWCAPEPCHGDVLAREANR